MPRSLAALGSIVFFVLAPGVVVGLVPWWLTGWRVQQPLSPWWPARLVGLGLLVAGAYVLVDAFVRFVVEGLGTPAPLAPPERLVVGGFYRYVRNPMYVAVLAMLIGEALLLGQLILLAYAAVAWAAVAAFVRWYEEPTLSRQFGAQYAAYRRAVPAWWPRRRPGGPSSNTD
ncbi:MAG: methyltransferase family protein [Chloroflexota bacterium]